MQTLVRKPRKLQSDNSAMNNYNALLHDANQTYAKAVASKKLPVIRVSSSKVPITDKKGKKKKIKDKSHP